MSTESQILKSTNITMEAEVAIVTQARILVLTIFHHQEIQDLLTINLKTQKTTSTR
jgi:hypothetical protein